MQFTSETSSNGVIERNFILDEITGVLWSPTSGTVGSPLLLAGDAVVCRRTRLHRRGDPTARDPAATTQVDETVAGQAKD